MNGQVHWGSKNLQRKWIENKDTNLIKKILTNSSSLEFPQYRSGMTPASSLPKEVEEKSGMGYAWIRDNCHIANALIENGNATKAAEINQAILAVFKKYESYLDDIISGAGNPDDVMNRPPVRAEGDS